MEGKLKWQSKEAEKQKKNVLQFIPRRNCTFLSFCAKKMNKNKLSKDSGKSFWKDACLLVRGWKIIAKRLLLSCQKHQSYYWQGEEKFERNIILTPGPDFPTSFRIHIVVLKRNEMSSLSFIHDVIEAENYLETDITWECLGVARFHQNKKTNV